MLVSATYCIFIHILQKTLQPLHPILKLEFMDLGQVNLSYPVLLSLGVVGNLLHPGFQGRRPPLDQALGTHRSLATTVTKDQSLSPLP